MENQLVHFGPLLGGAGDSSSFFSACRFSLRSGHHVQVEIGFDGGAVGDY